MRLYPKPGILTHRSRGMETIPAVWVCGSTVSRIIVSDLGGPERSELLLPPAGTRFVSESRPMTSKVTRLAPSQGGGRSTSGADTTSGVGRSGTPSAGCVICGLSVVLSPQPLTATPGKGVMHQPATTELTAIMLPIKTARETTPRII